MGDPLNSDAPTSISARLTRLFALLSYLVKHRGVEIDEVARKVGAPSSVILDDLSALLMCGVPPYSTVDYVAVFVDEGRLQVRFAEHFDRPVRFTLPEALALELALDLLPISGEGPLLEEAATLAAKIRSALPGRERQPLARWLSAHRPSQKRLERLFRTLRAALDAARRVRLDYYTLSRDERSAREVSPIALFEDKGRWYLAAHCHAARGMRFFQVDRILDARELEVPAEGPRKSATQVRRQYLTWRSEGTDRVRIRFSAETAASARQRFGPNGLTDLEGGGVELTLRCRGIDWLVDWLLPFGGGAKVLEPPSLERRMAEAAREILKVYRAGEAGVV